MNLIQFLDGIPPELRSIILIKAGAQAAANLSVTCHTALRLIQRDKDLWTALFEADMRDITHRLSYEEYIEVAARHGKSPTAYAWYWHVVVRCCTVCLWYIPQKDGLVERNAIVMCRECERDLRLFEKIYDV